MNVTPPPTHTLSKPTAAAVGHMPAASSCLLNPVEWQSAASTAPTAHRLRELEAIRERLTLMSTEEDIQLELKLRSFACLGMGQVGHLCELLSKQRSALADMSLQLGYSNNNQLLVFKFATESWMSDFRQNCTALNCRGGLGALGNNLGSYAMARAAAIAGNLDFVDVRPVCTSEQTLDVLGILPAVASAPRVGKTHAGNLSAATESACGHRFGTRDGQWQNYMPTFRREMADGLRAWARCAHWPPRDEPLDDVAIALRCGDAFGTRKVDYGLLPVTELAKLIPDGEGVRVGIVTQPHAAVCRRQQRGRGAVSVGDAQTADWAQGGNASSSRTGWQPDQKLTLHGVDLCACVCATLVDEVVLGLRRLRPQAIVSVRDSDSRVGALARLTLAPNASVCVTSTFCMWPVLASQRGYIAQLGTFPKANELAGTWLPSLRVLDPATVVRFSDSRGVGCGKDAQSSAAMRQWAQLRLRTATTVERMPVAAPAASTPATPLPARRSVMFTEVHQRERERQVAAKTNNANAASTIRQRQAPSASLINMRVGTGA